MRRIAIIVATLLLSSACGIAIGIDRFRACEGNECGDGSITVSEGGIDAPTDGVSTADAPDAPAPQCDPKKPFGAPIGLTGLNTQNDEIGGTISADGQRFYFARSVPNQGFEIWVAPMKNGAPTTPAVRLDSVLVPDAGVTNDFLAQESPSGLQLYFYSYRPGTTPGFGGAYIASRNKIGAAWEPAVLFTDGASGALGVYSIPGWLYQPYGFYLHRIPVDGNGNIGLKESIDDGGSGINVPVDKAVQEMAVTPDELHLYFSSYRSAMYQLHIWSSDRASTNDPWGQPKLLPYPINQDVGETGGSIDRPHYITADNCTLYYSSVVAGTMDMYKVSRPF